MIKKYGDIISSAFLLVMITIYLIATVNIPTQGSRLIPQLFGGVVVICAVIILFNGIRTLRKNKKAASEDTTEYDAEGKPIAAPSANYGKVALTLGLVILYAICFQPFGFLIATFLYLTAAIIFLAPKGTLTKKAIISAVVYSAIVTIAVYLVFTRVFWIMLPTGPIIW